MKKGIVIFLALVLALCALYFTVSKINATVLSGIETYTAPPYPKSRYRNKETYDYRISGGRMYNVPPTLTDTFICDIRLLIDRNKGANTTMSVNEILEVFDIYENTRWSDIAAYRSWTNKHFINSLDDEDKIILANEVVAYVKEYGVRNFTDIRASELF